MFILNIKYAYKAYFILHVICKYFLSHYLWGTHITIHTVEVRGQLLRLMLVLGKKLRSSCTVASHLTGPVKYFFYVKGLNIHRF